MSELTLKQKLDRARTWRFNCDKITLLIEAGSLKDICNEAADEITRLEIELAAARKERDEARGILVELYHVLGLQPDMIRMDTGERGDGEINWYQQEICRVVGEAALARHNPKGAGA